MAEFFWDYVWPLIIMVAESLLLLIVLLIAIAYVLYADRKIWAAVQLRRGPNVVGPWGLLQSFADLLKFVFKEPVIPAGANKGVFLLAPLVTCTLALAAWAVIPVGASVQVTSGASKNTPLLAPAGMTGSLNTNFRRSAKDCKSPHGPTTFGPRRICTAAQILRSA